MHTAETHPSVPSESPADTKLPKTQSYTHRNTLMYSKTIAVINLVETALSLSLSLSLSCSRRKEPTANTESFSRETPDL